MNEELLGELADAMKRREKSLAAIARWQEQLDDADEDIKELSARITDATRVENPSTVPVMEPEELYTQTENDPFAPRIFESVQE